MLRNKGLTDKVLLLGIDGMDPRLTRKYVDEGKMPKAEEQWLELNATKEVMSLKPIANGQKVLIVIGEHLNKKAITSYIEGGPEYE